MRALTAIDVVEAWGRGEPATAVERPLALLAAALEERRPEELAGLSLGRRDALLLRLRSRTFGSTLSGYSSCDRCGARASFDLEIDQVLAAEAGEASGSVHELVEAGHEIRFRLPNTTDLAAAAAAASAEEGRERLLARCVLEATLGGRRVAARELPEEVVRALGERIEQLDSLAEVPLAIECSSCGNHFLPLLDIGSFFWAEIAALAERLTYDVAALARAYGWNEREILEMGPARRKRYLELAGLG